MRLAGVVVLRAAAAPICASGLPPASDTPGYPYSVQLSVPVFVKTIGT
jgi:hypothetical protein